MRTIVEGMLPASFLVRYSIYMQTYAHIELASWHVVQLAEGFDYRSPEQIDRFLKIKKVTRKLVEALRVSARHCAPFVAIRILAVTRRIEMGLENRNLAVHGAWFFDDAVDALRVEHYFQHSDGQTKIWMHLDRPISQRKVDSAVAGADNIL